MHKYLLDLQNKIKSSKKIQYGLISSGVILVIIIVTTVVLILNRDREGPFARADIYPKDDKSMTAGTITVLGSQKSTVFALQLDENSKLSYVPDINVVKNAVASTNGVGGVTYNIDKTQITTNVYLPDGNIANNIDVNISETADKTLLLSLNKKDENTFQPGVYKLTANLEKDGKSRLITQDFAWGVLAINPLKSIYKPGEAVKLAFGVLDESGNTLCDANLELIVTSPAGVESTLSTNDNKIIKNPECNGNTKIITPDYSATFQADEIGTYKLFLTANTKNGKFFMDDSVVVKQNVAFDVERTKYPTRVFPYEPYDMVISVTATQDFKGQIVETIPGSFVILENSKDNTSGFTNSVREHLGKGSLIKTPDYKAEQKDNLKTLTWDIDIKKDQTVELYYTIKFPEISPEFYLVGPLTFKTQESTVFTEARQWQVASDAVVVSTGITATETQFGGLQRKIVYVNSNWYAFYTDGTDVWYKKSANGTSWGSAVDLDGTDADNYNPSVGVSGNTIIAFWVDDGAEVIEGRTIDTASADAQGTLCQTASQGTIGSTFMPTVAAFSTTAALVAYSDTNGDSEVNSFDITGLNGACTATDVEPGNVVFGTQGSGVTAGDRPVVVPLTSTTAMMIYTDGSNLNSAFYDAADDEWRRNDQVIAAVADSVYSVTTDGTSVWVMTQDSTTATRLYSYPTTDIVETQIDADAGGNGQDNISQINMFCPTEDNCKIVYTDDIDSTTVPRLLFVDCNDTNCSSPVVTVLDSDIGAAGDQAGANIHCVSDGDGVVSDNCKVIYGDNMDSTTPDLTFIDCTDDEDCSTRTTTATIDTDLGSSATVTKPSIFCPTDDDCKIFYHDDSADDMVFIDCTSATTCASAGARIIDGTAPSAGVQVGIDCTAGGTDCKLTYMDGDSSPFEFNFIDCDDAACGTAVIASADCAATGRTCTEVDSDVGTTAASIATALDCSGGATECSFIYGDRGVGDLFFVDCEDATCVTGRTITQIDATGGANTLTTLKMSLDCVSVSDCKFLYSGDLTSGSEVVYFVDCDNETCTAGSAYDLPGPRFGGSIQCLTSSNCHMVYYDGTSGSAPTLQFADCDTEDCLPTWSTPTAPWTSETNITSISLTYDSSNTDLIASILMDASETAYYITALNPASISWTGETAYDGFTTVGDMDNLSTPATVAGTTNMGALSRQGANLEFDLYGTTVPVADQNYYRFRDDTTALNTDGGWLAAQNTSVTLADTATATYRLRFEMASTGSASLTNYNYRLEYAPLSGSCAASSYAAVPSTATTEPFEMVLSSQYADAAAITASRLSATGTFVNGIAVEDTSNSTGNHTLGSVNYSEFEYAFSPTSNAVAGSSYCFRLTNAGSTTNFTYTAYPQLSIALGEGVIVYWKLDDAQGIAAADLTSNNLDGTLNNTPTWQPSDMCINGSCLLLDGTNDESISLSDTALLDFANTSSFSVALWAKRSGESSAINYVLSKADTTTGGYKVWMDADGDYCFGIDDDASWNPDVSACSSAMNFDDNQWHHVVAVRDVGTDTIYLYVDGLERASTADTTTTTLANGNSYYVGVDRDGTSNEWLGFIDEVKVTTLVISSNEVKTEYNAKGLGDEVAASLGDSNIARNLSNGLVGYWPLNETTSHASDFSGQNKTLTNFGTTTYVAGKFGRGSEHVPASSQYFSASITSANAISFWTNPDALTNYYINFSATANIQTDGSGVISANGFTDPKIYVKGVENAALVADQWQHVVVTSETPVSVDAFYVGRVGAGSYFDGTMDDVRVYSRNLPTSDIYALYEWSPKPIAYYNFDENTGTSTVYDISGNNYVGTMTGFSAESWTPGKFGSALTFNGSSMYITSASEDANLSSNIYTLSAWVKRDTDSGAAEYIIDNEDASTDGQLMQISASDTLQCNYNAVSSVSISTISVGTWYHVACVSDGITQRLYVNGAMEDADALSGSIAETTDLRIGARSYTSATSYFPGVIDDVKLYTYGRTSSQVIQDMNGGHPLGGSPIGSQVAYWKFDEMGETTANDTTINDVDLTLSSSSWTTDGKYGGAWNGTGSIWLARVDDPDVDFVASDDFTISMWFKSDSAANPGANQYLIDKQTPTDNPGYTMYFDTSGFIVCAIDDDTTTFPEDSVTSTIDYYDATWHNVMCIRDITGSRLAMYIDGRFHASDATLSATGSLANNGSITIADDDSDATNSFAGDIDEVKIYRAALTDSQVKIDINKGASLILGNAGTNAANPNVGDNSARRAFCPPGNTEGNCADGQNPEPVLYLQMDTSTLYLDTSTYNHTGADANDPPNVQGYYGQAGSFDGVNQAIDLTNTADLTPGSSSYTFMFWAKIADGAIIDGFVNKYNIGTNNGFSAVVCSAVTCGLAGQTFHAFYAGGASNYRAVETTNDIADGNWHHYAVVADPANDILIIYEDGVYVPQTYSAVGTWPNVSYTGNLYIGSGYGGGFINGVIDEYKTYRYPRTAAQVAWDMNFGKPIAWYRMDECSGTVINEAMGNGFTGTLTNAATPGTSCTSGSWLAGADGAVNASIDLDGSNDFITVADPTNSYLDFPAAAEFSLSGWFNRDTFTTDDVILAKRNGDAAADVGYLIYIDDSTDQLVFEVSDGTDQYSLTSTSTFTATGWNHFSVVWDDDSATNTEIYINGRPDLATDSGTISSIGALSNAVPLRFGDLSDSDTTGSTGVTVTHYFDGKLDDIRIYTYPQSLQQVRDVYNTDAVSFK